MILKSQRHLFDMPRETIYLNAAYMTPSTRRMHEIAIEGSANMMHPWEMSAASFYDEAEATRTEIGSLLNIDPECVAFIPAASYGAAVAAKNLPVGAGQYILLLEGQFPSNVYPWMTLAKEKGAKLLFVKAPADDDWTAEIISEIEAHGDQIAMAALPNVHWANGCLIDLEQVSAALKKNGSTLVLDVTQSLGAVPLDVAAVDPDFMFLAGYKWMFGPYSTGFMYVAPRHLGGRPLEQNWISRRGSEDFARLVDYTDEYQAGARRFDVGERSNFILMPLVREGIRQVSNWGINNIRDSCEAMTDQLADIFVEQGFTCIDKDKRSPHILAVKVGLEAGERMMPGLKDAGVVLSLRGDMLRISPHLWVDSDDMERFETLLKSTK